MKLDFAGIEPRFNRGRKTGLMEGVGAVFETDPTTDSNLQVSMEIYKPAGEALSGIKDKASFSDDLQRELDKPWWHYNDDTIGKARDEMATQGIEIPEALSQEAIEARRQEIIAPLKRDYEKRKDILARSDHPFAAEFIGGTAAAFTDPLNVATLAWGAPSRMGLLGTMAVEGFINAGIEAASTPARNKYLRMLDQEEESALANALMGGAFGATAGGLIKTAPAITRKGVDLVDKYAPGGEGRQLAKEMNRALDDADPEMMARIGNLIKSNFTREMVEKAKDVPDPVVRGLARQVATDIEDEVAATGRDPSPEATQEHEDRLQAEQLRAAGLEAPEIPDRPQRAIPAASIIDGELEEVRPGDLKIQPEIFQFKSDADSAGVTDKLRTMPKWDTGKAGVIYVFEYADGTRAVADGHQRTSFANRLMAADPDQDIKLAAKVFRESEGWTPETVRVEAALKNISEAADGMTMKMARDAAKILRVDPERIMELPAGSGIQRAQSLGKLSDDAFALVINDVIPDASGALIGRMVGDPAMHLPIARLLERLRPNSEGEARSIIQQALTAPVEKEVTEDLFGAQEELTSLFLERAKVLEKAKRILADDKKTFRTLTDRGDKITGAGNKLNQASNQEIRQQVEQALIAVDKMAYRAGSISEALDNGAKNFKETGKLGDSAAAVVDAIRGELERNGLSGATDGVPGRNAKSSDAGGKAPDPFEGFDEPGKGQAVADQIAETRIEQDQPNLEEPREGFSEDELGRQELGLLVEAGAPRDVLDNHPVVVAAIDELTARPQTVWDESYGSPEWHAAREYVYDGETIVGTEAMGDRWIADAEAFAGPDGPGRDRVATIFLGPPAAGKSYFAEQVAAARRMAILDSDEIKKTLPEYDGGIGAGAVHEESGDLMDDVLDIMLEEGTNLVVPKVGGSPKSIRKLSEKMKANGYQVEIINMAVTKENAYTRMIGRFVSTGRIIPPSYVDVVGDNPSKTYRTLREEGVADGYAEIDNNGPRDAAKPITDRAGERDPFAGTPFDDAAGGREDTFNKPDPGSDEGIVEGQSPGEAGATVELENQVETVFTDLDPSYDLVPVGVEIVDGVAVARTVTRQELAAEMDADDEFAEQLGFCLK